MPVELSRLHVGEHAATGEESHALGRFQREAGAAAGDGVDDQLGVRPVLELSGTDIEGAARDLAQVDVLPADAFNEMHGYVERAFAGATVSY